MKCLWLFYVHGLFRLDCFSFGDPRGIFLYHLLQYFTHLTFSFYSIWHCLFFSISRIFFLVHSPEIIYTCLPLIFVLFYGLLFLCLPLNCQVSIANLLLLLLPIAFLSNIILSEVFNDSLYAHKLQNLYLQSALYLEFQMHSSYYLLHIQISHGHLKINIL